MGVKLEEPIAVRTRSKFDTSLVGHCLSMVCYCMCPSNMLNCYKKTNRNKSWLSAEVLKQMNRNRNRGMNTNLRANEVCICVSGLGLSREVADHLHFSFKDYAAMDNTLLALMTCS